MSNVMQVSDGVLKEIMRLGQGNIPQRGSIITVHCTGFLANPLIKFWSADIHEKLFEYFKHLGYDPSMHGQTDLCSDAEKSTKDPGQSPFTFQVGLGKVIRGWDEACLTMQQGEIAKILIRSDKGYGSQGFPAWGIAPNADLLFEIELLAIH